MAVTGPTPLRTALELWCIKCSVTMSEATFAELERVVAAQVAIELETAFGPVGQERASDVNATFNGTPRGNG